MSAEVTPAAPLTSPVSTERVSAGFIAALGFAQFGIFVALLAPVFVSMSLKAQEINPADPAAVLGTVLPIGALGALFANPLAGALSDRTRTRWGRRRPWLIGGVVFFFVGLIVMAVSTNIGVLMLGWLICQVASNATTAALFASFADNVPQEQRGRASGILAVAQNVAILAGIYLAVPLSGNLPVLFVAPGILAVISIVVFAIVTKDQLPDYPLKPLTFLNVIGSFWTNPFKNPDFGFAWWSRFLITLATFMFTTYRLLYMQDHLGLSVADATAAVAFGVLLYTLVLLVASWGAGWLSDKVGRRKIFVGGSTALFAVGLIVLAHADSVAMFYVAEIIMGFAYGIYGAVDNALIVDVLPHADRPGKDLGVINIANALPQSLAPALGLAMLGFAVSDNQNYTALLWGAGVVALLGAVAIIPIKRVR